MDFVAFCRAATRATARAAWAGVRRFLNCLAWAAVAAFAGAGGCWCCGYAGRESWMRVGSLRRPPEGSWWATDDVDRAVTREAARGIREIEAYLAAASPGRPQPPPPSSNEA